MIILNLGVHEVPHFRGKTAGDVASILEHGYKIVETFFNMHEAEITNALVESYTNSAMAMFEGAPATLNPAGDAIGKIETMFKKAVFMQEFDGLIPGVPTRAALTGASKWRKRGRKVRASRSSFVDSDIYRSSFTVWVDDNTSSK